MLDSLPAAPRSPVPDERPRAAPAAAGGRIPALDGVRGLAILVVLIHNASWIERESPALPLKLVGAFTASGWTGVSLFFVLSGFLITRILRGTCSSATYFRSFYVRRTLRIFPLYYAFLLLAFTIGPLVVDSPGWVASVRKYQILYWTYLSNWLTSGITGLTHLWSLAVEEQFYLLWPLAVRLLSARRLAVVCGAMIVSSPILRYLLNSSGLPWTAAYQFTFARWDALAAGAVIALLVEHDRGYRWLEGHAVPVGWVTLVALLVFAVATHQFHAEDPTVQVIGQSLVAALFAALIAVVLTARSRIGFAARRAFSWPWLRSLGKYSYAIYVVHWPIVVVASLYLTRVVNVGPTPERLARLAVYSACILGASWLVALVTWHGLEKHFLRLKDRVAARSV